MNNYVCRNVTELPGYTQAQLMVQSNSVLNAGEIYLADSLDNGLHYGNFTCYIPEVISDIENQDPVLVLDGSFETLADGRRPKGNSNYTQYSFMPKDIATAIRLDTNMKFEIGFDAIDNSEEVTIGGYLIPVNGTKKLSFVNSLDLVKSKIYLVVEALKNFRLGGAFGSEFTNTVVARVKKMNVVGTPSITSVNVTPVGKITIPCEVGTKIADISVSGGTEPYSYELPAGIQDNDLMEITGTEVKVKTRLTELKEYDITVKVTDSEEKTKEGTCTITTNSSEITDISAEITPNLQEGNANVQSGATIATLSTVGGNAPFIYSLNDGGSNADNGSFVIDNNILKVGSSALVKKTYNVSIKVTDTYNKEFAKDFTIDVGTLPISNLNISVVEGLQQGNENVNAGATVATLSTTGGVQPYSYSLNTDEVNGADNSSFVISGDKLNVGETPLTEKDYKVSVKVTDKNGSNKIANATISVAASA